MTEAREARRLYVDEGMTVRQVAEALERSQRTVRACLDALGVQRRFTAPDADQAREIRSLYQSGLSIPKVAKVTGRSIGSVRAALIALGVPRRRTRVTADEAAEMARLYAGRLSMVQVAERTGRPLATVHRALHVLGVRVNRTGRNLRPTPLRTPHEQVERIIDSYRETRCMRDTADALGISASTVRWHLTRAGEPLVSRSESMRHAARARRSTPETEAIICRLYVEGALESEIQEAAGVSRGTVTNVVRRNGIPPRGRSIGARRAWVKRRRTTLASVV